MSGFEMKVDDGLLSAALDICAMVKYAGGRAIMVGGCVRDAILGIPCKDIDIECYGISVDGITGALTEKYSLDLVGVSFGVIKVKHYDIDISLPRLDSKSGAGHRGFVVECVSDLSFKEASARRDFTINAIMYDPLADELIDPWNGVADLNNGVIRHVSEHFSEDPLRVLRAMQFTARFGFPVAYETVEICREISQDELPCERLAGEWEKLLFKGMKPSMGLDFLKRCGWLKYYPELEAMVGCEQTPQWHPEGDVWQHTLRCLDAAAVRRSGVFEDDMVLMLAALCHDMGKPAVSFVREDGCITSPGHDLAGEKPALAFIKRIWQRLDFPEKVVPLVKYHMAPAQFIANNAGDRGYRRLALAVSRMDLLGKLAEADIEATTVNVPDRLADIAGFMEKARALDLEKEAPKPILLGRHLLQMGVKPGPEMGKMLNAAFEAQLDGAFTNLCGALKFAERRFASANNEK